jgi:hypothetical protein
MATAIRSHHQKFMASSFLGYVTMRQKLVRYMSASKNLLMLCGALGQHQTDRLVQIVEDFALKM